MNITGNINTRRSEDTEESKRIGKRIERDIKMGKR